MIRKQIQGVLLLAAVGVTVAVAATAQAQVVSDPGGEPSIGPIYDIRKVEVKQVKRKKFIQFKVTTAAASDDSSFLRGSIVSKAEYFFFDQNSIGDLFSTTDSKVVFSRNGKTRTFKFPLSAIGTPKKFTWHWTATDGDTGEVENVPNKGDKTFRVKK